MPDDDVASVANALRALAGEDTDWSAKHSPTLLVLIRDLRRAVITEASGGGEDLVGPAKLRRDQVVDAMSRAARELRMPRKRPVTT